MNHDELMRLATLAFDTPDTVPAFSGGFFTVTPDELQRFATLVAAAERRKHQADIEKWKAEAVTAEKWRGLALSKEGDGRCVQRIQQEAAEKEREACAALCDDIVQEEEGKLDRDYSREDTAQELAVLIRARGQQ